MFSYIVDKYTLPPKNNNKKTKNKREGEKPYNKKLHNPNG